MNVLMSTQQAVEFVNKSLEKPWSAAREDAMIQEILNENISQIGRNMEKDYTPGKFYGYPGDDQHILFKQCHTITSSIFEGDVFSGTLKTEIFDKVKSQLLLILEQSGYIIHDEDRISDINANKEGRIAFQLPDKGSSADGANTGS
jgi:hypothetical protein